MQTQLTRLRVATTGPDPAVRLELPSCDTSILVARQALAAVSSALGAEPDRIADAKLALSELCTNAVLHGPSGLRDYEVEMAPGPGRLALAVRDHGAGVDAEERGIGLAVAEALSDGLQILGEDGTGSKVMLSFDLDNGPVAPGPHQFLGPLLSRTIAAVCLAADFPLERLSDGALIGELLAAYGTRHLASTELTLEIAGRGRCLVIRFGPLATGGVRGLVNDTELPGLGSPLLKLSDSLVCELAGGDADGAAPAGGEYLLAWLAAERDAAPWGDGAATA